MSPSLALARWFAYACFAGCILINSGMILVTGLGWLTPPAAPVQLIQLAAVVLASGAAGHTLGFQRGFRLGVGITARLWGFTRDTERLLKN